MALPEFREDGWLPEGHYDVSWEVVISVFGGSPGSRRERVLHGLLDWRDRARSKNVSGLLVLNGSFISAQESPSDFDALLVFDDHVRELLENDIEAKGLLAYSSCKSRGFDLLILSATVVLADPASTQVWDRDKKTGKPKGVLEVAL